MSERGITLLDLPCDLTARMRGPRPPARWQSNGCSFAPDWIGPHFLTPACHWHDWAYHQGGDENDRTWADRHLYLNLRTCGASRRLAFVYWSRVRWHGVRSFAYSDPSFRPRGLWAAMKLAFGRYVRW